MGCHAVHGCSHGVLAHAEENVAPGGIFVEARIRPEDCVYRKLRLILSHRGGFFAARIIVQCFDRLQGGFGQQR